ncbi:MAG: hypothetical protein ACE5JM_08780, partial [Armatimonadota bacterium]
IALLLGFQTLCGHVYHTIGLLTGAFMLGLAGGGSWMSRRLRGVRQPLWVLAVIQLCIVSYAALLALALTGLVRWSVQPAGVILVQAVFCALMAASGFLVGAVFPLAGRAQLEARAERTKSGEEDVGGAAGTLYAADLVGACIGGLVASTVLIPVLGMMQACVVAAVLGVPTGVVVAVRAAKGRTG